jgi:PAS domain S-box-containing protein
MYLMGISEDITDRKKMQDTLRENEFLLRAIVDTMVEGVVVCSTTGEFLVYNTKAEEIMGRRSTDSLNRELIRNEILYPDKITPFPADETSLKRALQGKATDNLEMYIRNQNIPEGVYINATGRPIYDKDGKLIAGVTMFRDISKRKKLESLLKETEQKLKEVIHAVGEGVVMCDTSGKFILFNQKAEEIVGQGAHNISPDEWPAKYQIYLADGSRLLTPDELLLMRALRGEVVENQEVLIDNKSTGVKKFLLASSRPVRDTSGKIVAAIADFKDVTEVKQLESLFNELKGKYNELAEQVLDRSRKNGSK